MVTVSAVSWIFILPPYNSYVAAIEKALTDRLTDSLKACFTKIYYRSELP
jgi:hypothetical protein